MKVFIEKALPGLPFWDICCDHGHIGMGAIKSGAFSEVHFVDQVPHIMKKLEGEVLRYNQVDTPYFLHCLPAERLEQKILGTFLVAGVGGLTIRNIVGPLLDTHLIECKRLLLSPQTDEKVLVSFLESENLTKHYELKEKISIPEGKRFRSLYILDLKPR